MNEYDIVFIGGGPAGYEGAILAGKMGLRAAVIEKDKVGGTCLQRGCIPTKAILHSAKIVKEINSCSKIGLEVAGLRIDYPAISKRKDRVVSKLTRAIELQFQQHGVELIHGQATLASGNRVLVGKKEINAAHIVIATGSSPSDLPNLKFDGRRILSSDDVLRLEAVPERLLVIGAGAVGIEWALIFRYLGGKVVLVEIMPQVLPGSDGEIAGMLRTELQKQEITVYTAASVAATEVLAEGVQAIMKKDEREWTEHFSHVLLAVGRKPDTSGLPLASLGIECDAKGFIKVDANLRTGAPTVFACGDVIGAPLLAHKAAHQAMAIVHYLVSGKPVAHHPIPAAVFSFPEVASVGSSEEEVKKCGIEYKIGRFPYSAGSRSNAIEEKIGLIKIVADKENQLLGAHIIGAEAAELMPILSLAVSKKMRADEFQDLVFIHPTLSEGLWEAIGEIARFSIHV